MTTFELDVIPAGTTYCCTEIVDRQVFALCGTGYGRIDNLEC